MDSENIQVLYSEAIETTFKNEQFEQGVSADTTVCSISWNDGESTRGYIKRFLRSDYLGVINEITGYILARHSGLPVPQRAGIIKLPSDFKPESVGDYAEWGFVSQDSPGKSPASFYNAKLFVECSALMNVVANWGKVNETIAFDDWAANTDRHGGNILVADPNNIILIDHSHLPIKLKWTKSELDPKIITENILYKNLIKLDCTPLPQTDKIAASAKTHKDCYASAKSELKYWWQTLLSNDVPRQEALERFFEIRATDGPSRIAKTYNLLDV